MNIVYNSDKSGLFEVRVKTDSVEHALMKERYPENFTYFYRQEDLNYDNCQTIVFEVLKTVESIRWLSQRNYGWSPSALYEAKRVLIEEVRRNDQVLRRYGEVLGTLISATEDLHDEKRGGGDIDPSVCPVMDNCVICTAILASRKVMSEYTPELLPEMIFNDG